MAPDLEEVVRAALGPARRVAGVQRLRGATKKGVYRLTLDDETSVIGYVWAAAENRLAGLDERRLLFYRLALHLSLIAGPLRLLDGDFPDREPMRQIAEFNTDKALAFVR